jgi:Uma2 family endonuclease
MSYASSVRWIIQDIEALPENEWIRYEIVDGELFVTRPPHYKHQQVAGRIFIVLLAIAQFCILLISVLNSTNNSELSTSQLSE